MKKNIGIIKIIALLVLFPLIIWELSLKKTYQLSRDNKQLGAQVIAMKKSNPRSTELVMSETSALISNGKLLEIITDYLKEVNVEIVSYQPSLINEDNTCKLYAGTIVLSGNYINLVKTIDTIEKKKLPVKLSSARFSISPAKGKKVANAVELTLIFQQIES